MAKGPILVVSGTNRPGANALKIAGVVLRHYRRLGIAAEIYSLAEMPREIFDPASYASKPAGFVAVQQKVVEALGLHVVTPEYNGSFPGVLKYFIDMLKFPESFESKPVAFIGEAMGIWGGLRSVEQLQMIFGYRNAHLYGPRVFISGVHKALDSEGKLTDAAIDQRISEQVVGFSQFARRFAE